MTDLNLQIYKKLYLIRQAEKAIIDNYNSDDMKTPMHMSMGGEAISAGVCQALKKRDQVFGTYRSHALYLSKTMETEKFFAEMYGKLTGPARGRAGSMHLSLIERGFMCSSAIVASHIPVAIGAAFANKFKKNNKIVAVFFGDGATDEGNFWESLNKACLMGLPILFVCEDNDLAMYSYKKERHGYRSLVDIVSKFNCNVFCSETTNAEEIFNIAKKAISLIRKTGLPSFLSLKYYRYLEHVGINEDFNDSGRLKKEFKKWFERDPVRLQREKILKAGLGEKKLLFVEQEINKQIEKSIKLAKKAPFVKEEDINKNVFYEKKS